MGASRWIHIDVELIVRETDAAFLLRLEEGEEVWIPKSQVSDPEDYSEGDADCSLSITEWIAEKNGLA